MESNPSRRDYLNTSHTNLTFFTFFFFNDPATPDIYTLSLHDALPIFAHHGDRREREAYRAHPPQRDATERRHHRVVAPLPGVILANERTGVVEVVGHDGE